MKIPIRKSWGQYFINDNNILNNIIKSFTPKPDDNILEIGPGKGALTLLLSKQVKLITAVEIDPKLVSLLKKTMPKNIIIQQGDILKFDPKILGVNYKIIGNLPYYITTKIIFKFLKIYGCKQMTILVQKEVADRITANPGNRIYGRLSIMVQASSVVKKHFNIPATAFYPKPKVDSTLISLFPRNLKIKHEKLFNNIVKSAFNKRRKMIKNSLKEYLTEKQVKELGNYRPEELTIQQFINISDSCMRITK